MTNSQAAHSECGGVNCVKVCRRKRKLHLENDGFLILCDISGLFKQNANLKPMTLFPPQFLPKRLMERSLVLEVRNILTLVKGYNLATN